MSLRKKDEVAVQLTQSIAFLDVLRKHLAIFTEHYRQPISELSVLAYAEDLADLSAEDLDAACRRARKESEFMPVSAAIISAHRSNQMAKYRDFDRLGPRLEWSEEAEEERKKRAAEWQKLEGERLARAEHYHQEIADGKRRIEEEQKKSHIAHPAKPLEQQKLELKEKGWLQ